MLAQGFFISADMRDMAALIKMSECRKLEQCGLTVIHFSFTQNALPHYSKKVPPWQRLSAIRIAELFDDKNCKIGHAKYTR